MPDSHGPQADGLENMTQAGWAAGLMRALIAGSAVAVGAQAKCPWVGVVGLGLLGLLGLAVEVSPHKLPAGGWRFALALACAASLLVPATPLLDSATGPRA